MESASPAPSVFWRSLATLCALLKIFLLVLVGGFLVTMKGQRPLGWGASGVVTLLVLKAWFALICAIRLWRNGGRGIILPIEFTVLGIGYCVIAADFVIAAMTGDGWQYGLIAVFPGVIAPVWFVLGRRAQKVGRVP